MADLTASAPVVDERTLSPVERERYARVLAAIACARVVEHCKDLPHIDFRHADVTKDALTGKHDIVIVMGVLESVNGRSS